MSLKIFIEIKRLEVLLGFVRVVSELCNAFNYAFVKVFCPVLFLFSCVMEHNISNIIYIYDCMSFEGVRGCGKGIF